MESNGKKTINKKPTVKKTPTAKKIELDEIKALKDEIAQMKKILFTRGSNINEIKKEVAEDDINKPLATNELISVISLVNNVLTLTTEKQGAGTSYVFHEFGEQQPIIYGDLIKIIHNQRGFAIDGHFFIANKRFVRTNGLERYYDKMMNPTKLLNIFSLPQNEVSDLFKNSAPTIQNSIVSVLVDKIARGENIAGNVIYGIQQHYDKDITKMVKDRQSLLNIANA